MERAIGILAVALFAAGTATPGAASDSTLETARVCLGVDRLDDYQGLGNFKFSGTVTAALPQASFGTWLVAKDASENYWAQNGGGTVGNGGEVKFGVSNISTYPLTFLVMRVETGPDFDELKRLARFKRAITPEFVAKLTRISPYNGCRFDLDGPDRRTASPIDPTGKCACR